MKKVILLFICFTAVISAKAQSGYNYAPYGVEAGFSVLKGFTNVQQQNINVGGNIGLIYNYSPYVPLEAEFQFGKLSGGGVNTDKYGRQYVNNFKEIVVHGDYQLGESLDYSYNDLYNALKGLYLGTGLGAVFNSNTVQRTNPLPRDGSLSYVFPGSNTSVNLAIPIRVGYEFKVFNAYNEPYLRVDVGFRQSFVFGEGLDGYNDPENKFKNNAVDQYSQFYVGVKYNFGNVVAYTKLIRQFN